MQLFTKVDIVQQTRQHFIYHSVRQVSSVQEKWC